MSFYDELIIAIAVDSVNSDVTDKITNLKKQLTTADVRANNNNILRTAAEYGQVKVLKYLREEFGLTADDARANNNYALQMAAGNGHVKTLKYLRKAFGLTTEDARTDNNYAFRWAAAEGNIKVLKCLKEDFGLIADDVHIHDNHAFREAAEYGQVKVLKYMKEEFRFTADDARADDNCALRLAAKNDHIEVLKYLQEAFGLTTVDARADNNYALRWAARYGRVKALKYLRKEFGLTADDARADNNYALRWAAENGYVAIIKYLKDGFGLTANDAKQCGALIIAKNKGYHEVVRELEDNWIKTPFDKLIREETSARIAITTLASVSTPDFYEGLEFYPSAGSTNSGLEDPCVICMDALLHSTDCGRTITDARLLTNNNNEDDRRHTLAISGCGHVFHAKCLTCLSNTVCPLCRGENMAASSNILAIAPYQDELASAFIARVDSEVHARRRLIVNT